MTGSVILDRVNDQQGITYRSITFRRDGLALAGHLFVPEGFDEDGSYPAVIVQGSFTSVKEQMPDAYARLFAERGYVALTFDYAYYGESDGMPRQYEDPAEKLADLRAAVSRLLGVSFVSAVGMVGVCTSATNGVYLAAEDDRLAGIATIAGMIASPQILRAAYGDAGIARRIDDARAARRKFDETGEATTIPVYSETDPAAVNYRPTPGAYDYYLNPERGKVPQYINLFDVRSWDGWLGLDPLPRATRVTTPTIVVHSDGSAMPDQARALYTALPGEKELAWLDGNHFDYYDDPARMAAAVDRVVGFFDRHIRLELRECARSGLGAALSGGGDEVALAQRFARRQG